MSAGPRAALPLRVLVVDDDPEIVTFLATLLELEGIESTVATSAAAALEKLEHGVPSLVLLDIAMPGKDGFALAAELKADPQTQKIPLVALTALAMRGDDDRVRQAGFDGYLTKPIDRRALEHTVAKFCAERRAA